MLKLDEKIEMNLAAFGNKPPRQMGHRFINNSTLEKIATINSSLDLKNRNLPWKRSTLKKQEDFQNAVEMEKEKVLRMIESNKILAHELNDLDINLSDSKLNPMDEVESPNRSIDSYYRYSLLGKKSNLSNINSPNFQTNDLKPV